MPRGRATIVCESCGEDNTMHVISIRENLIDDTNLHYNERQSTPVRPFTLYMDDQLEKNKIDVQIRLLEELLTSSQKVNGPVSFYGISVEVIQGKIVQLMENRKRLL